MIEKTPNMKIMEAILRINSDAKCYVIGDDIDTAEIVFDDGETSISKENIKAEMQND
tara:strand:+ start:1085 stop:1255 length:171 start_codon:yes stop_codon:yes gene_type:complete